MGDLLMSLPAVRSLRRAYPQAELALLMKKELLPLLENHPDLDRLLPYDPAEGQGWGAIGKWGGRLRSGRFDTAIILNPTRQFHVASFLAGIPRRIGYRRKWGFLLTDAVQDTKEKRNRHEAEYNLELMEPLGVPASAPELVLAVTPEQEREAAGLLPAGCIALHPWTSNRTKALPLSFFEETAQALAGQGRQVAWIGEPEAGEKPPLLKGGALDLTGRVPLRLLAAVLKRCGLLISNDSGPAHVAAGVGTPLLVVAPEPHRPVLERWAPLGKNSRLLFSPDAAGAAGAALELLSKASLDAGHPGLRK